MAVLPLIYYGNPLLKKKSKEVKDIASIGQLVDDMFEVIGDAVIVILCSNYGQLEDALDYHNLIHDSEHVQDSKEQSSSFFPFRTTTVNTATDRL